MNSSGEPLERSGYTDWLRDKKGEEEGDRDAGVLLTSILKSKGMGIGIGGGLVEKPAKDLVFFPLGVAEGEQGRFEPDEEVDIIQEKPGKRD